MSLFESVNPDSWPLLSFHLSLLFVFLLFFLIRQHPSHLLQLYYCFNKITNAWINHTQPQSLWFRVWIIIQFFMREHSLICRDPKQFPRLWDGKLISMRAVMGRGMNSLNIQIFKSLFLSLSALAPQISMTKWTYNWKPGGPEILLTFFLTRLDISSGELQGWYEHMERRWWKEKVIKRSLSLVFVQNYLIL